MPIVHRRSKPVNGSVLAFAVSVDGEVLVVGVVVGVVLVVVGAGSFAASFFSGVLVSLEGEVPLFSSGFFS